MKARYPNQKTLGPKSAKLVRALKTKNKAVFSLKDTQKITGKSSNEAKSFVHDVVRRSLATRINAGLYLLLETGQETVQLSNWPLIAKALAGDNNYYISHYAAMRIHGMTTHALIEILITLCKRRRAKKVNHIRYQFVYSKPEDFWGIESKWISKQDKINVSDLERTILDGLNRPEYCGGISEVIRGVWLKENDINWEKLISYAKQFSSKAAVKRLGYILETLQLGAKQLPLLNDIICSAKDYVLLDPQGEKEGKYLQRWRLRLNIENIAESL